MSDSSPNNLGPQVMSHETRLQSLEAISAETRVAVANLSAQMQHTQSALQDTRKDLAERIDRGFDSVILKIADQSKEIVDHRNRLTIVEKHSKDEIEKVVNRKDLTRKVLVGGILAGSGIFITKIVEHILPFFGVQP